MPLKKLALKPGIDRENTRYTSEGGYYECDKVRFRSGTPEKIGGWARISTATFLGVCRSLSTWVTLNNDIYTSVGTNLKFYIESGGSYNDITPIRATLGLTNPFTTVVSSSIVTVTDAAGGYFAGDFVTFTGATAVGGLTIDGEYEILAIGVGTYTIDAGTAASSSDTGGGAVTAAYQINVGPEIAQPYTGWSAGEWSYGTWGFGGTSIESMRLWSRANFGEDLIFGPRGGAIYYWDASSGTNTRAVRLDSMSGATEVPLYQNFLLTSDISRFVFAFGCNDVGTSVVDPLLIRWSAQEDAWNWAPAATNQAGGIRLSQGSEIVTALQSRQEILVWTTTSLYSMQFTGGDVVWSVQLVGDNLSITSQNSAVYASGVAYWMGVDRFYKYDGRVQPLNSRLRKFVFGDIHTDQYAQVFAGANEAYSEVWWFYCGAGSDTVNKYVVYNYVEDIWYYGTIARTAWLDSGLRPYPIAATYERNIVEHENGIDDNATGITQAIPAYIQTAEFDLDDGHQFTFVDKVLPDMRFDGSTADTPSVTVTLYALAGSGAGYNAPASEGGTNTASITRTTEIPVEQYTDQLHVRVRGRQLAMRIASSDIGVTWQAGSFRLNMRPDGRR